MRARAGTATGARTGQRPLLPPLALGLLVVAASLADSTAPVTPFPPSWPHRAPWDLNRELLLPVTDRIVFLVDVPRGAEPKLHALDDLVTLASRYGRRPAVWMRLGTPLAPVVRWRTPPQPRPPSSNDADMVRSLDGFGPRTTRDDEDSLRLLREVPSCPEGPLPAGDSFVAVRYLGDFGAVYGAAGTLTADGSCGARRLAVIYLAQGRIARDRPPVLSQEFLERRALAHEYGHVLGLASNPAHGRWGRTVPFSNGPHCIHRECALSTPTVAALARGQMLDYCEACARDIDQAREHWRTGKVFPEVPRLPPPDPVAHVARLKPYNFHEGGEAERLRGYGKAVLPALMRRLPELSGGGELSPREQAAALALRIIADEDARRRNEDSEHAPSLSGSRGSLSPELLRWWREQGGGFMAGDAWILPAALTRPAP